MQIGLAPISLGFLIALVVLIVCVIALLVPVPGWVPIGLIAALAVARMT